jgi:hypothetical protein
MVKLAQISYPGFLTSEGTMILEQRSPPQAFVTTYKPPDDLTLGPQAVTKGTCYTCLEHLAFWENTNLDEHFGCPTCAHPVHLRLALLDPPDWTWADEVSMLADEAELEARSEFYLTKSYKRFETLDYDNVLKDLHEIEEDARMVRMRAASAVQDPELDAEFLVESWLTTPGGHGGLIYRLRRSRPYRQQARALRQAQVSEFERLLFRNRLCRASTWGPWKNADQKWKTLKQLEVQILDFHQQLKS